MLTLLALLAATPLLRGVPHEASIAADAAHDYTIALRRGESADVVVHQRGVDVVVEVRTPSGKLLDEVDGPTGRTGDERVELFAEETGEYQLRVRPFDAKEAGNYAIGVLALRSRSETASLLRERAAARDAASQWLGQRGSVVEGDAFVRLATEARVIGLGEATHGSREFGDTRLRLTKLLIETYGYRVVALEASAMRVDAMQPTGWIGRRTQGELFEYVRGWNAAHPNDAVTLIGVDAQDNAPARSILGAFLQTAYGDSLAPSWKLAEQELAAADAQTAVFGDSSVNDATRRTLIAITAQLDLDDAILRARHGAAAVDRARRAARMLAQFADFNAGGNDPLSHSRDWYMAANVLEALQRAGADARGVYWAHNAHVAATQSGRTAGGVLRSALGCRYTPIALTFGEGSFIAQVPNDPNDRLLSSTLGAARAESMESVLGNAGEGARIAAWGCGVDPASAPPLAAAAAGHALDRRPVHAGQRRLQRLPNLQPPPRLRRRRLPAARDGGGDSPRSAASSAEVVFYRFSMLHLTNIAIELIDIRYLGGIAHVKTSPVRRAAHRLLRAADPHLRQLVHRRRDRRSAGVHAERAMDPELFQAHPFP